MNYKKQIESFLLPKIIQKQDFLNLMSTKYKDDVISYVQSNLDKKFQGQNIWDSDNENNFYTNVKSSLFSDMPCLNHILFYFMLEYLKYDFLINSNKSVFNDMISLNKNLIEIDYIDSTCVIIDLYSSVLDCVYSDIYSNYHLEFEKKLLNNEYSEEDLIQILQPEANECLLASLYIGNINIEQYIYSKYGLLNNSKVLESFFNILNLRNQGHSFSRYQIGSVLFNFNYIDYLDNQIFNKKKFIEKGCVVDKWNYIKSLMSSAKKEFKLHEKRHKLLQPFYKDIIPKKIDFNFISEDNKSIGYLETLKYLECDFNMIEITNILIYSYLLYLDKKIIKRDEYDYNFIKLRKNQYLDIIWDICDSKKIIFHNECEINLFSYIFKICLIGNISLEKSLRDIPKNKNIQNLYNKLQVNSATTINVNDIKENDTLNDIFDRLVISCKQLNINSENILGCKDRFFLNMLIEVCIQDVGIVQTVECLNKNKLSSFFWPEIELVEKLDKIIPQNNISMSFTKF